MNRGRYREMQGTNHGVCRSSVRAAAIGACLAAALPLAAAEPIITSVTPTSGGKGTVLEVRGQGFGDVAEDLLLFVSDGVEGVPVEVLGASEDRISARLGPAARPLAGGLGVWKGRTIPMPGILWKMPDRMYTLMKPELFRGSLEAAGTPGFVVTDGSPDSDVSSIQNGMLVLTVSGTPIRPSAPVELVVKTNGSPKGGEGGEHIEPRDLFGLRLELYLVCSRPSPPSTTVVAQDLAVILDDLLAPMRFTVTASENKVFIEHEDGIAEGFLATRFDEPQATSGTGGSGFVWAPAQSGRKAPEPRVVSESPDTSSAGSGPAEAGSSEPGRSNSGRNR